MQSEQIAPLVSRLVTQFFEFGKLQNSMAFEDQQICIYDQLRLLISSVILNDINLIKQVLSLSGPVANIFSARGQLSEATRRLKDALALVELYLSTVSSIEDKIKLVEDEIELNIMIAKSYEARSLIAGGDRELCLRIQYFWSAALFTSYKYDLKKRLPDICQGLDDVEAQYISIIISPSSLQTRLQQTLYKTPNKFTAEFSVVERIASLMVQRNKLQYASKIYDLGLLQIILNAEAVPGCPELISRALNMSAQINDALLGTKDRFQASQDVPLLWSHFRRLLESIRQRALQTLGSNECRQQYNSSLLELLRNVWQSCLELLGTPPCSFSVFAMGSLSRLEAAAFSDVEYGMVVENVKFEDHQFFKTLRDLFEFEVGCFGERFGLHIDDQGSPSKNPSLIGTPSRLLSVVTQEFDVNSISLANSILHPQLLFSWNASPEKDPTTMFDLLVAERNRFLNLQSDSSPNVSSTPSTPTTERSLVASAGSFLTSALQQAASIFPSSSNASSDANLINISSLPRQKNHALIGKAFLADHAMLASSRWLPANDALKNCVGEKIELKSYVSYVLHHSRAPRNLTTKNEIHSLYLQPLVYLITDLSLIYGITCNPLVKSYSTCDCIRLLQERQVFSPTFAQEVEDAFNFMYNIKMRAHLCGSEQPENDTVIYTGAAPPGVPSISLNERLRLYRIVWTILRPLYNLLPFIITEEERAQSTVSATIPHLHTHRRHASLPNPAPPSSSSSFRSSASSMDAKSKISQLTQDPALSMLSKTLPDGSIRSALENLPHSALKCLIITLLQRNAAPNVHRRFFRIVARVSTEANNHRLEYHRILEQDGKFLFSDNEAQINLIKLILIMCESYPDEEGSRIIFKESQRAWELSLPSLECSEMEEIAESYGSSSIGCVAIHQNQFRKPNVVFGPLAGTSLSLAYGFQLAAHQLLYRLIGYGLPPMRLNLLRRRNPPQPIGDSSSNPYIAMLVQADRIEEPRLETFLEQKSEDMKEVVLKAVSCSKCSNCRNYSDLILGSLVMGLRLSAADIFLEPFQDPLSTECKNCTHRMMVLPEDPRLFIDSLLEFVDLREPQASTFDLRMKNILFCMDSMKNPINRAAAKEFCSLSPYRLVERWMNDIVKINKLCDMHQESSQTMVEQARASLPFNGAPPSGPRRFFRKSIGAESDSLILLPENMPVSLLSRIRSVQDMLMAKQFRATHLDLLSNISPICGLIYNSLLGLKLPPSRRYELAKRNDFAVDEVFRSSSAAETDALFQDLVRLQNLRKNPKCYLDDYNWISPSIDQFRNATAESQKVQNLVSSLLSDPAFTSDHPPSSKAYEIDSLAAALFQLDYESILNSRHRQHILNLLVDCPPGSLHEIRLMNAAELDSSRLLKIVKLQASQLAILDLTGCAMIRSASCMITIADTCKKLRHLNISKTSISSLGKTIRLVGTRVPCMFSSTLEILVAEEMPRLHSINVLAPRLKHLRLSGNPVLKDVRVVTDLNVNPTTHFSGCDLLSHEHRQVLSKCLAVSSPLATLSASAPSDFAKMLHFARECLIDGVMEAKLVDEAFSEPITACVGLALRNSKSVEKLFMKSCRFSAPGFEAVLKSVVSNPIIQEVRVVACSLDAGTDAAIAIAAQASSDRQGLHIRIEPGDKN